MKSKILSLLFLLFGLMSMAQTWSDVSGGIGGQTQICGPGANASANYNGELYVAGQFDTAGSIAALNIAKWNGIVWGTVGAGIIGSRVYALCVYNGELFAAGSFSTAGGVSVNNIAKWNGSSWAAVGGGLILTANTGFTIVYTLCVYNGNLYAGGQFTSAGGNACKGIAKWDGSNWTAVGNLPDDDVRMYSLCIYNGELYSAGFYATTIAGVGSYKYIKKWNDTSWTIPSYQKDISSMIVFNSELYVGGDSFIVGGDTSMVAKWNGSSWATVGRSISNNQVKTFGIYNGELYVGGYFNQSFGGITSNIAKWDGAIWSAVGGGLYKTKVILPITMCSPGVFTLCVFSSELYAGGVFFSAGGALVHNIAKWYSPASGLDNSYSTTKKNSTIFPNPFRDIATINIDPELFKLITEPKFSIYDALGNKVSSRNINNSTFTFERQGLNTGIYFYVLSSETRIIDSGKLIIE